MDPKLLKQIVEEHGGATQEFLRQSVEADAAPVARRDIKALFDFDQLRHLNEASILFSDPDFALIPLSDQRVTKELQRLVEDGVLSQEGMDNIRTLGKVEEPRWKSLGFSEMPHDGDIKIASTH